MIRKDNRLKRFDYSRNGAYFITICVKDMKCILSKICVDEPEFVGVGAPDDPQIISRETIADGAPDDPKLILSDFGIIIENEIQKMNDIYDNVNVNSYVIMPNHVHLMIIVSNTQTIGTSGAPSPTNSVVARYVSTLKRFANKECGTELWQRSYYDHIIRNEEDYIYHLQYIDENPKKWLLGKDEYYA